MSVEKIAKLLAVAEQAGTEAESQAFLAKAQELATAHAITLAEARAHRLGILWPESATSKYFEFPTGAKSNRYMIDLLSVIGKANNCTLVYWSHKRSARATVYGVQSDIDTVEAFFATVSITMIRFAEIYLKKGEWKTEQVWRSKMIDDPYWGRERQNGWHPITKQSARASYYNGFSSGLGSALQEAVKTTVDEQDNPESTELVLRDKAQLAEDLKNKTHPRLGRGSARNTSYSRSGSAAGQRDGRNAGSSGRVGTTQKIGA
jgi:hypothetical protein